MCNLLKTTMFRMITALLLVMSLEVSASIKGVGLEAGYLSKSEIDIGFFINGDIMHPLKYTGDAIVVDTDIPFIHASMIYDHGYGVSFLSNLNIITAAISSIYTDSPKIALITNFLLSNNDTNFYLKSTPIFGFYVKRGFQWYIFNNKNSQIHHRIGGGLKITYKSIFKIGIISDYNISSQSNDLKANLSISKYFGFSK